MKKIAIVGVEGSGKTVMMAALGEQWERPDERERRGVRVLKVRDVHPVQRQMAERQEARLMGAKCVPANIA